MALLNEDSAYEEVCTKESSALFLGGGPTAKELLHVGTLLCRFTPRAAPTSVCPWWIFFHAFRMSNMSTIPGIGDFLMESGCRIQPQGTLSQPPGVRLSCVEPASRFTLVRLIEPVYAFMGPTAPQRMEPHGGVIALRGGEFRVWIPGVTASMLQWTPPPRELFASPPVRANGQAGTESVAEAGDPAAEIGDDSAPDPVQT
ncbi:MAG: hypothetical protein KIT83_12990 [Bryobacterales bacterium]|nr:hypothetical protein [Bryobacterales bacterium]